VVERRGDGQAQEVRQGHHHPRREVRGGELQRRRLLPDPRWAAKGAEGAPGRLQHPRGLRAGAILGRRQRLGPLQPQREGRRARRRGRLGAPRSAPPTATGASWCSVRSCESA
jgi:hypothetical protein